MYAAAGGASLASRQARKRQKQINTKNSALLHQQKLALAKAGPVTPTKIAAQSRPFHQLPQNYLRTPNAQARKLSAGCYASATSNAQSKLLLPISEGNQQQSQNNLDHIAGSRQHQNLHQQHERRHHNLLTKSATASLPFTSHADVMTPPSTPTIFFHNTNTQQQQQQQIHHHQLTGCYDDDKDDYNIYNNNNNNNNNNSNNPNLLSHSVHMQIPLLNDPIIVTPATPLASPGRQYTTTTTNTNNNIPNNTNTNTILPPSLSSNQLERKCSVYRGRQLNALEENFYKQQQPTQTTITTTTTTKTNNDELYYYNNDEYNNIQYGLQNGGHKWSDADICDSEHRHLGVCTCDHIECAQGRAAWLERGRRCSVQDNPASCHRRWVKRNRIHDSSLGGSSDDEDLLGVLRGPSSFANAFLYVGLGTVAIGLVIAFVGTGEKGFKTVELRLIGPSLIVIGLVCCILRIFFCICPSHCISSSRRARKKKNAKVDADHTTSLLRGDSKRVQIARGPNSQPKLSQFQTQQEQQQLPQQQTIQKSTSISKTLTKTNESVEALRQIATTSLFLQNEQNLSTNRIVIQEPEKESSLEMKKIDSLSIDIYSLSDDEEIEIERKLGDELLTSIQHQDHQRQNSKLFRQRAPTNQPKVNINNYNNINSKDSDTILMETSLMIINNNQTSPVPSSSHHHLQHHHQQQQQQHFFNNNENNYPSTSIQIVEPTEIVLSPAKLGQ